MSTQAKPAKKLSLSKETLLSFTNQPLPGEQRIPTADCTYAAC